MAKIKKFTPADMSALTSSAVVVRKIRGQLVISKPTVPRKSKSVKKKEAIERFKEANAYARSILEEPGMRQLYSRGIKEKNSSAHAVARRDYLNSPEIHSIQVKDYSGAVGEKVRIKATDDFQVTEVEVSITSGKGKLLEQGSATRYIRKPDIWVYTVTVINPDVDSTVIVATAKDRPWNKTSRELILRSNE